MNKYSEMIRNKLIEYYNIEQAFSLADANNKLNDVIGLIEGINLFPKIANN